MKLKPDDPQSLHLAAMSCLAAKQPEKSRDYAARGVKAAPRDSRMYEILAQIDLARQQPEAALKWLQMGVDADGPPRLWWTLGTCQIAKGRFDQARQTAQGLRKKVFPKRESQSAAAQVEPGLYADLLEAQIEQAEGHWLEATKRFGDRADLRFARARYLVRKGEKNAAERIRKLAEKSKNFSAQDQVQLWRDLAPASLAADDIPQAERLCQLIMAQLPGDLRVRLELFDLAVQANDVKLMDTVLDEVRRVENGGPIWHYATALRLIFSPSEKRDASAAGTAGNTDKLSEADKRRQAVLRQALDHLAESLRLRPDWSRALMFEGLILEESHQDDAALAKYLEAVRQGENGPDVARRALQLLYGKGDYAAANALLRRLEGQQVPFTTELFREQSRVLGGLRDYAGALNAAQRAAANSKDYRDYLWLAQLLNILGRREEAEKALHEASLRGEKAPETCVVQVQFFASTGRKDRAEEALAVGREKIPAAEAPLALAECCEILGKSDEAGQQYALALKQKPNDPGVIRSVASYWTKPLRGGLGAQRSAPSG